MFQQNSWGRIYVRGKPTPELTRAWIIQLYVQCLSVSQISADVKPTKHGVSKTCNIHFMDEASVIRTTGHRRYGHAFVCERAMEVC